MLTGIRGVAAIWVILFHFYPWYAEVIGGPARGTFPFIRDGFLGVDLFFLLSGFVLTMSYGPRLSRGSFTAIGQFMISRAFRILPMHWAVLVVLAVIVGMVPSYARFPNVFTPKAFLESVLLTQGLLPDATRAWNRATWSISDEWVAYMLFPLLARLIWMFRSTRACLLIAAAALLTLLLTMQYALQATTLDLVVVGGLLRCACEFVAGAFACKAWQLDQALLRRLATPVTLGGLLVLAGAVAYPSHLNLLAPFGLLALVLASGARGAIATFLFGNVAAVFLGEISYSLYLVHIGIVDLLWVPDVIAFVRPLVLPVRIGVCILAWSSLLLLSWLGYRHVERPFRTYGQQFSRRAFPVRATATV